MNRKPTPPAGPHRFITPLLPEIVVAPKIEVKPRLFEVVTDAKNRPNIQKTVKHLYKHIQPHIVALVSDTTGRVRGYSVMWENGSNPPSMEAINNQLYALMNEYPGDLYIVGNVSVMHRIKSLATGGRFDLVTFEQAKNMYLESQMWVQKSTEPYETSEL